MGIKKKNDLHIILSNAFEITLLIFIIINGCKP